MPCSGPAEAAGVSDGCLSRETRYVLVKGDLGLGNRILCLLSAMLLARITDRRLIVDWSDPLYARDGANAFPHLFTSGLVAPLAELPETDSVEPPVWRGRLAKSARDLRREHYGPTYIDPWLWERFTVDLARVDRPERVLVFTSFFERIDPLRRFLIGPLATLRRLPTDALLTRLWDDHLALVPALQGRVDDARRSFASPMIGVHVRASDLRARDDAIERTVARIVARRPELGIFLASDNRSVVERYRRHFPRVATTAKWYPPPGEPMHDHPDRPDRLQGAGDALIDLHLLAACEHLVIDSRSSFGRLAALRSAARADRIVDLHPGRLVPLALRRHALRLRSRLRRAAHT